jgi:toxin ParE1/3/4
MARQRINDLIGAVEEAYTRIGQAPKAGTPRYRVLLNIPGLRAALVDRFPYVVFYIEHTRYIDVIRVLHQHRDLPAILFGEAD